MTIEATIETNEVNVVNESIHVEPKKRGRGRPRKYANEEERIAHHRLVAEAKKAANRVEREAAMHAAQRARENAPVTAAPLLVNVAQAANMLQVSRETVRSLIRANHLPATKIFGILRIQSDAVKLLATVGTQAAA